MVTGSTQPIVGEVPKVPVNTRQIARNPIVECLIQDFSATIVQATAGKGFDLLDGCAKGRCKPV